MYMDGAGGDAGDTHTKDHTMTSAIRPIKADTLGHLATVLHRDGTVTMWDVRTQGWSRGTPTDAMLATCAPDERCRITRHLVRHG